MKLEVLAHREFRRLFLGLGVSVTGTQMHRVAVAWQLYELTGSAPAMGLLGLARIVPIVIFSLGGGVLADRVDRRRLMLLTQSAMALNALVLAAASALDAVTPGLIYAVAALSGVAVAFDAPARQSLVPQLIPREQLPGALSLVGTAFELGNVVGPALAGYAIAHLGVTPVYLFDAASFVAVVVALLGIAPRPPNPDAAVVGGLSAVKDGLRFLRSSPLIWSTMMLDFFATLFGGATLLLPAFAKDVLGAGPEVVGVLFAAMPAGAALAGIVLSLRRPFEAQGPVLLGSVVAYGLAMAAVGASPTLELACVALALAGAADMVSTVIRQTMRQLLTPDALRGRMTSVTMIFFLGGPQLGELEAGLVAGAFGLRAAMISGGLLAVASTVAVAALVPALARLRREDVVRASAR